MHDDEKQYPVRLTEASSSSAFDDLLLDTPTAFVDAVPEPSSLLLAGFGAVFVGFMWRRE